VNSTFEADCLANTGAIFPTLGLIAALLIVCAGVAVIGVRKKLGKGALALIPLLILASIFIGATPRAEAATNCGGASASPSSSPSASSSSAPAGDPAITNVVTTFDQSAPWTVTATGTGPITFRYYTFSYLQFTAAHLSIDANTGVVTPPVDQTLRSQACESTPFNTISGISVTIEAVNSVGAAQKTFTIDDHVWCNSRG